MKDQTIQQLCDSLRMKIILYFFLGFVSTLLLLSCNTVHKTTASQKINTDSAHVSSAEAIAISKSDSVGTKTEAGNYEKESVYVYDTIYQVVKGDTVLQYVPRIVKVYEKGNYVANETAQKITSDSVGAKQKDSTGLVKSVAIRTTDKETSRMPIGLIIAGVFGLLLLLAFVFLMTKKTKLNI